MKFEQYDLAVVNKLDDTTVYQIEEIKDERAELSYESGYKRVSGGVMPVSCLMKPTKKQLRNSGMA